MHSGQNNNVFLFYNCHSVVLDFSLNWNTFYINYRWRLLIGRDASSFHLADLLSPKTTGEAAVIISYLSKYESLTVEDFHGGTPAHEQASIQLLVVDDPPKFWWADVTRMHLHNA